MSIAAFARMTSEMSSQRDNDNSVEVKEGNVFEETAIMEESRRD